MLRGGNIQRKEKKMLAKFVNYKEKTKKSYKYPSICHRSLTEE
jgi:hypothetical protein